MEALAAASSVLAVVSLAIQLADNVQRLIDFWDSIKEAPTEVAEIRSQLRILGTLLRGIELDIRYYPSDDEGTLGHDCLLVCKGSIAKLEKLSKEWDQELSRNGIRWKWSCLKKALRENELARYWVELERAKSTLIMHQCLRNGQRQDSLHRLITKMMPAFYNDSMKQLSVVSSAGSGLSKLIVKPFKKMHLGTTTYDLHLSFGTIRVRLVRESVAENSTKLEVIKRSWHWKIVVTFLPKSTSWRILECTFNQRYNSINAGIQTFNLRPGRSLIFDYASRGDLEGVKKLIGDGLASPNDVDPDGWTVLHCAAAAHQAIMCQMLLILGAVPDAVTKRQETPLLLATHSNDRNMYRLYFCPRNDESASLNTVRVLVEQGQNDPMQSDDIGETSIFTASRNHSPESWIWLMNQDEYEVDLNYATPGGMTAAALIAQREDLSATLFEPLLRHGIVVDAPCTKMWHFQYGYWFLRFHEPSMIQCAVWTWYDKLLNSYGRRVVQSVPSPLATIKTLLAHGASFHSEDKSIHSLLDGLVLNIIQFNVEERPLEFLESAMTIWLDVVQELGFNLKDYLRIEAAKQFGKAYDLGAGMRMMVCFDEVTAPHIWTIFQGPQEREKNEFVDRISKCALWTEWKWLYAVPKRIPKPTVYKIWEQSSEMIWVKCECCCPSLEAHLKCFKGSDAENKHNIEISQTTQSPPDLAALSISSRKRKNFPIILSYVISGRRYRHEFTFYVFVLTCFFGCSYFARFWIAGSFVLFLKLFQDAVSYLI